MQCAAGPTNLRLVPEEGIEPTRRRPQEAINKALDECELFVGLLWRRWGQPTGHPAVDEGDEGEAGHDNDAERLRTAAGA